MKHLSILVPLGHTSLPNIDGTHQICIELNSMLAASGRPALFNIQLVGLANKTTQRYGLFVINPDALIADVNKTGLTCYS